MKFSFIISTRCPAIERQIIAGLFLLAASFTVAAQDSTKLTPAKLSFNFHRVRTSPYGPFIFPLSRTIDYSNYPLTANEILRRNDQIKAYNRMYNMITNRNKNGFIGNLLGLQRTQRTHPSPAF